MKQKQIKIPYFLFVQLPYYSNLPISINILFLAAPIHRHHHQKADQKVLRPCSNSNLLPATGTYQQPRPLCTPHSRGGGKPGSHIKKAAWLNMAGQARGRMAEHGRPGASMAEHGRPGASMAEHGGPGASMAEHGRPGASMAEHGRPVAEHGGPGASMAEHGGPGASMAEHGRPGASMAEHGRPGASMAEHGRPGASMAEHGRPGACFPLSQSLILSRAVRTPSRSTV